MGLTKCKLGRFIERVERRNYDLQYGIDDVRGISNAKQIQPTKADISNRSFERFQIVERHEFVFNRRTTRMGEKIGLGYNNIDEVFIVTEDYVVFRVMDESILMPDYLYIFFRRPEFDRYARWDSWGSATEFFNWEEMCDVSITIPPLPIQQKYVEVYNAMLVNQRSYEYRLDYIKCACDTYYDRNKRDNLVCISELIDVNNKKNQNSQYGLDSLRGISDKCRFTETTATVVESAVDKYLVINDLEFAVNFMCLGNWGKFYLAYNDSGDSYIVSPACSALKIKSGVNLNPYYFLYILQRDEFQRKCVFIGDGNTRGGINTNDFGTIEIPFLEREKQDIIAKMFQVYDERKDINEQLKDQIQNLCSILIQGSLKEVAV